MRCRAALWVALLLAAFGEAATAQATGQGTRPRERVAEGRAAPRRQQLEQRLRTGVARAMRQRVGLDDAQMARLAQTHARFDVRRRELVREERATRVELRRQILAGDAADQQRLASALDGLLTLQRRRIDLQIEEQRDLASFMSPMQRAKYAALQEQIRRRVEGIRSARPGRGDAGG